MEHAKLENTASTALMLPKENGEEKMVILTPSNGVGKILIREDTILANLQGCACGRAQFTCGKVHKNMNALCWGRQSDKKYYCCSARSRSRDRSGSNRSRSDTPADKVLLLLSFTFGLSLVGSVFFCFTNTVNDAILSNMVIRNNSLAFSLWRKPNVQPVMKVHLFNYTNWERFRDGLDEKLKVQDVGPYSYAQQVERVNIKFDEDAGTVSFQERNSFTYLPDKTVGAHFDQVNVPNLPLLGVISKAVSTLHAFTHFTFNLVLNQANHHDAFIKLPVHRFLWGYDDNIIDVAKAYLSLTGKLNFDKFGLLVTKNGTVSDVLTINTGQYDMDKINVIERLNGDRQLNYWGDPKSECNSIAGTDGSIFPPTLLDRKTPLHVFFPNLCRRMPFVYEKDVELSDGVQLLRYRMPANVFDDPAHNPANHCYCEIDSGMCPPKGVINVTACAMGAPALASFPHFYHGDPKLTDDIQGLTPDPARDINYLDIHPTLGIALSGKSSIQLNIQVKKSNTFNSVSFLKEGLILPIAWIEIGVEELPESLRSLVYHGTFSTAAAQLGLIAVSIITLVISGICLCLLLVRKRQKPCATLKKFPNDYSGPTSVLSELMEKDKNQGC